jgi:hypothetical protein
MTDVQVAGWLPKCNPCVAEYLDAKRRAALSPDPSSIKIPEINIADTLAPQWQSQSQFGQMMFACIAIPVCQEKHLAPLDPKAIQPASALELNGGRG